MIGSMFRVLIGFVLACLAAGFVKVVFALSPAEVLTDNLEQLTSAAIVTLFTATHSGVFAAPFALIAAAIAEWQSIRTWYYYAVVGIAIALAGFAAQSASEAAGQPTIVNSYAMVAYIVAGLIGGYMYWLVAGRRAGDGEDLEEDLDGAAELDGPEDSNGSEEAAKPSRA